MAKRISAPAKASPYRVIPVNKYAGLPARDRQLQRRERLIEAACKLFATSGFANTSIQALSEAAGCALRTFYEEFGSREALLAEMYERTQTRVMRATVDALARANPDPPAFVRAGVDAYVASMTSDPNQARIVLVEAVGVGRELDKVRRDTVQRFVRDLQGAIGPRPRFGRRVEDQEIVILALAGATDQLLLEWLLSKGRLGTDRVARVLYGLWSRGLMLE